MNAIVDESEDKPHGDLLRGLEEGVAAIAAALGGHQARALELGHDHFQKTQGNGLGLGDIRELGWPLRLALGQFEDGPEGVFMFLGDQHAWRGSLQPLRFRRPPTGDKLKA